MAHCSTAQDCGPCPCGPVWQQCYSHRIGTAGNRVEEGMSKEAESALFGGKFPRTTLQLRSHWPEVNHKTTFIKKEIGKCALIPYPGIILLLWKKGRMKMGDRQQPLLWSVNNCLSELPVSKLGKIILSHSVMRAKDLSEYQAHQWGLNMVPIPLPQIRFFHLPSSHSFKRLSQNANFKKLSQKKKLILGS